MKKIALLATLVFSIFTAKAQDSGSNSGLELGLKVSPALAFNHFGGDADFNFENKNLEFRGGFGLVADYFFKENYAFNTGLEYGVKGGHISYNQGAAHFHHELNVQYLMLPIGLKLFTNEVATDTRVFFLVGTSLNAKLSSKIDASGTYKTATKTKKANELYKGFEADLVLGAGAEWQIGTDTKFFGGLSYHRGLSNINKNFSEDIMATDSEVTIKNDVIALDLGLKF